MGQWVKVCGMAPEPGKVTEAEADGRMVCLANVNGDLFALDNVCPHRHGPLGQGWIDGTSVVCPWHAWSFDAHTGEAEHPVTARVKVFPVKVDGGDVLVDLD